MMMVPRMSASFAPAPSFLVQNYGRSPLRFSRGEGCRLWDTDGKEYVDAFAAVAVCALGHAHPKLVKAISEQAAKLMQVSNYFTVPEQEALGERLVKASFPGRAFFCNSGTEANEAALKVARLWNNQVHGGNKPRIIAFTGAFHGRTLGALACTANPKYREPFAPLTPVEFLPFGDLAAITAAMDDRVQAIIVEPVQGEGGVIPAPAGFLAGLRALCDQHGALLIFDEVQIGIARSGKAFGHQWDGCTPDLMSLAKGLGGGVPIGAVIMREACAALLTPGTHGTTFGGGPLASVAALTVLDEVLNEATYAHVTAMATRLRAGLARVFGADAIEIRGRGLLIGVQLPVEPMTVVVEGRKHGVIVGPSGNNTLRLAPPLIIDAATVDTVCERLDATWKAVKAKA
jgi:acetylornithine/N-succinyldiaminopimelate aminotransferase